MSDRVARCTSVAAGVATCAAGALIGTQVGAVLAVVVFSSAAAVVVLFVRVAALHGWLTRQLRNRSVEGQVAGTAVRRGSVGGSVFVAGLARPAIFCDDRLLDELTSEELRAVALHERAHQVARDPLRNAGLAAVAPLLGRCRRGKAWLERRAAHREIAADRYALANGADRRAIAAALLKVPPAAAAHAASFAPAVELRLRALLGEDVETVAGRSWSRVLSLGVAAGAAACLALVHPVGQFLEVAPDLLSLLTRHV